MQYMTSEQLGAPQMGSVAGSEGQMLTVLDACLVTGFGTKTASSVTQDGDEITLSFGTAHGFLNLQQVILSGGDDAALNATHKIKSVAPTSLKIEVTGVTQLTGTISVKVAPLDWENMFGTANALKRAYRSKDPACSDVLYLNCQLENTGYNATNPVKMARFDACRDMEVLGEQIDSYTAIKNDSLASDDGLMFWVQSMGVRFADSASQYGTANIKWFVVGDGKFFYFGIASSQYYLGVQKKHPKTLYWFGYPPKVSTADVNNLTFSNTFYDVKNYVTTNNYSPIGSFFPYFNFENPNNPQADGSQKGVWFAVKPGGASNLVRAGQHALMMSQDQKYSGDGLLATYDPLTLGLTFTEVHLSTDEVYRCELPYLKAVVNQISQFDYSSDMSLYQSQYLIANIQSSESVAQFTYFRPMAFDLSSERKPDVVA